MIIPFQNILFLKEFIACNCCYLIGLFTKIKRGPGAKFCCTFSARLFHKSVPYLILHQWTKFQCYFFSFSIYQIKCVIKFLFGQLLTLSTIRFTFDQPLKQLRTEGKRGEDGNTKICWVSWEEKELFRSNEKHFL